MSTETDTPTWAQVMKTAIDRFASELHVAMPASIVKYDRTKQKATVQPLLQRKLKDGTKVTYPLVQNVPCMFPRTNDFAMTYQLKPNDTGLLVIAERSMDRWLASSGGVIDPNDPRKFNVTDGVFIPGLFPYTKPAYTEENVTILKNKQSRIRIYETGKFAITNLNTNEELFKILHDLLIVLENALIRTAIGPQPFVPNTIQELTAIQSRLDTLKE